MQSGKRKRRSDCPISFTLDVVGDKWALLIIRDLMFLGKRNYGEFLQSGEGIATNILSDRLRRLEQEGILTKEVDPENKKKFVYGLTEKGLQLLPLLLEMIVWGARNDARTAAPAAFVQRLKRDRSAVIAEILARKREEGRSTRS